MTQAARTRYFLGVDQGGSKTIAAICDENGRIVGKGVSAGLKTVYVDDADEVFIQNIRKATEAAAREAGIGVEEISAACGGLSGADWGFDYLPLCKSLYRATGCRDVTVINDCIGAMRGGSSSGRCAVVCAGSGLNVAVRRGDGQSIVYGYYVKDAEQGAGALGKLVLDCVMDASIGLCEPTALTEMVLKHTGHKDARALFVDMTVRGLRPAHKDFARHMLAAYRIGDPVAERAVDGFCSRLAHYVVSAARQLGMLGSEFDVVYSGSVFKDNGTLVAEALHRKITASAPSACCVHARYEPVLGALLTLLDRRWGGKLQDAIANAFDTGAIKHGLVRRLEPTDEDEEQTTDESGVAD